MQARVPIDTVIASPTLDQEKRQLLDEVQRARHFASTALALPDNDSYRHYVELPNEFVVWNVFATPALSLEPIQSCFLIVGCLEYRGYYDKSDAEAYAASLESAGYDVFLGGVSAYSTLGWFDDPVLSSMLRYGKWRTIETVFHELAHQKIYVKHDSAFNEAFATAVADLGLARYQATTDQVSDQATKQKIWEHAFIDLILRYQERLRSLYASSVSDSAKHEQKAQLFSELKQEYRALRKQHTTQANYDEWVDTINNAKIASVVTYFDLSQHFKRLFSLSGSHFPQFYRAVAALGKLPPQTRHTCLNLKNPLDCLP